MYRNLNTLTTARKELGLDELRFIGESLDFLVAAIERHPNLVQEEFFSAWMRKTCGETDAGIRQGSTTEQMLSHYKDLAASMADRIVGLPATRGTK